MKILVAPLNWGLGHASRCVPLVQRLSDEGHEVILGGDGDSLTLLRKHFPKLRYVYLAPLNLRYSAGHRQVWAMLKAFPQLIRWALQDHAMLNAILREETIDQVISDNRFGLYLNHQSPITNNQCECIYMTHQLHIMLPKGWKWAESIASRVHARIYAHFNKVWVPDYEEVEKSLAGELSHPKAFSIQYSAISYIGSLSRFEYQSPITHHQSPLYDVVAVLSGLEPHRTLLEKELIARYTGKAEKVLIVQGLMSRPNTRIKRGNITIVPYMSDAELVPALLGASRIIARSGYSTIMDLAALGVMDKAELIPTPGQPEQEYLATLHNKNH
jgi:predicted glycosyltransferase